MNKLKKAQSGKRNTRKIQKHINKKTRRGGAALSNTLSEANVARAANAGAKAAVAGAMNRADKFPTRTGGRVFVFIMAPIAAMTTLSLLLNG